MERDTEFGGPFFGEAKSVILVDSEFVCNGADGDHPHSIAPLEPVSLGLTTAFTCRVGCKEREVSQDVMPARSSATLCSLAPHSVTCEPVTIDDPAPRTPTTLVV